MRTRCKSLAWDDVSGAPLNLGMLREARQEETEYVNKTNLYKIVSVEACYQKTGKAPTSGRWIEINQGDPSELNL